MGAENGTSDDVWKSKDGANWELVAETVPWQERGNQMVTVFDGFIWIMGGHAGATTAAGCLADRRRSELGAGDPRRTMGAKGYDHRPNGGVPVLHGRMWILDGGYVGTGGTTLSSLRYDLEQQPRLKTRLSHNDVWSSADGCEWTCHLADGKAPWVACSYHDTAAWDGKLWVLGGHRGVAD